jgi:hypothetical protein
LSREAKRIHEEILGWRRELAASKQTSTESEMRFTTKEFFLVATTTIFAFAGFLVDNALLLYICLAVSGLAYLFICWKHVGPTPWRIAAGCVVVLAFGGMIFLVHRRELKREQSDVADKLIVQPVLDSKQGLLKTG